MMSPYTPLPEEAVAICEQVPASARLVAHLTLVHDVAKQLVTHIRATYPEVRFQEADVLFGAAIHDIGKAIIPRELSEPGKLHELEGMHLLLRLGISERRARFAFTHGNWESHKDIEMEDLLVSLADNCWKSKRIAHLEAMVVDQIAKRTKKPTWEVFASVDCILEDLAGDADQRLSWQAQFPVGN